jgi:hypothetical protein
VAPRLLPHHTGIDHLEFLDVERSDLDEWAKRLGTLGVPHSGGKELAYTNNAVITFRGPEASQQVTAPYAHESLLELGRSVYDGGHALVAVTRRGRTNGTSFGSWSAEDRSDLRPPRRRSRSDRARCPLGQIDEQYRGTSALGAARWAAWGAADGVVPLILVGLVPAVTVRAAPAHTLFGPQEAGDYQRDVVGSVTRARRRSAEDKRKARQPALGAVGQ